MKIFSDQIRTVSTELLKRADFQKVKTLTKDWKLSPQASELEVKYSVAVVGLAAGQTMDTKLPLDNPKTREYILGIWALTHPPRVLNFLRNNPPRSENEKKLLLLALQIQQKSNDPQIPKYFRSVLSDIYESPKITGVAGSIAKFKRIIYPSSRSQMAVYETQAQAAAQTVRNLRTAVAQDLQGRSTDQQIAVLMHAEAAEDKVSDVLLKAPLPKGLTAQQTTEYRQAIAELAGEFKTQAQEYRKLLANLQKTLPPVPPSPSLARWPAFRGDATQWIESCLSKKQFAGALIVLDQWKTQADLSSAEYFEMRARILFSVSENPVLRRYILNELTVAGQTQLIEKWKSL